MKLSQLFRPKWQHESAEVRRAALAKLDGAEREKALRHMAEQDPDKALRVHALREIGSTDLWISVLDSNDKAIRSAADEALLANLQQQDIDLNERIELLKKCPVRLDETVLRHRPGPAMQALILERHANASNFTTLLPLATDAELRNQFIAKIDDTDTLNRLIPHKATSAAAKQRLAEVLLANGDPEAVKAAATDICQELEQLTRQRDLHAEGTTLDALKGRWAALKNPSKALQERFERGQRVFAKLAIEHDPATQQKRATELSELKQQREQLCEQLENVANDLAADDSNEASEHPQQAANLLQKAWQELPALPAEIAAPLVERFESAQARFQQLSTTKQLSGDHAASRQRLLRDLEQLLGKIQPQDESRIKQFKRDWENATVGRLAEEQQRFAGLIDKSRERIKNLRNEAEGLVDKIPSKLDALETLLEGDEIKGASRAFSDIQRAVRLTQGIADGSEHKQWQARVGKLFPRIKELRDWESWSGGEDRKRLSNELEALVADQSIELPDLAEQLSKLQQNWKKYSRRGRTSDKADPMQLRFDELVGQARERCEPHFAALREKRQEQMGQIKAMATGLLEAAEQPSSDVDWKALGYSIRDAKRQLSRVTDLNTRDRGQAARLLREALKPAEAKLLDQQQRFVSRKEGLIEQTKALLEQEDVTATIEQAKALQAQWTQVGAADRKTEQQLWGKFREQLDAVFARRNAERDQQQAEYKAELKQRQELVEQLETAAKAGSSADFHKLQGEWDALPPQRGKAVDALDRRLGKASELLQQQQRQAADNAAREQLSQLSALAVRLDRVESGDSDEGIAQTIAELPKHWREAMQSRADRANNAELQAAQAALASELCLELEIAAGIDSPAEVAQERMDLQVARLNSSFTGDKAPKASSISELQRQWYAIGPLSEADRKKFGQRAGAAITHMQTSSQ